LVSILERPELILGVELILVCLVSQKVEVSRELILLEARNCSF
jgi:hypothetical protein